MQVRIRPIFTMILFLSVVCLISIGGTCGSDGGNNGGDQDSSQENTESYGKQIGDTMADFTLLDCEGNAISLSDFSGQAKAVFINNSAGWCSVCRREATRIEQIYQEYKDEGLVILGPLFETNNYEPASAAFCRAWKGQYGWTFPTLVDDDSYFAPYYPTGASGSLSAPLTILLDENMEIKALHEGAVPSSVEDTICQLVGRTNCGSK
jgi:peroxiredoxin